MQDPLVLVGEISDSGFMLLGVLVVMVFAIGFELFRRQRSGIRLHAVVDSMHPVCGDNTQRNGGAERSGDAATGADQPGGSSMDQRETR